MNEKDYSDNNQQNQEKQNKVKFFIHYFPEKMYKFMYSLIML